MLAASRPCGGCGSGRGPPREMTLISWSMSAPTTLPLSAPAPAGGTLVPLAARDEAAAAGYAPFEAGASAARAAEGASDDGAGAAAGGSLALHSSQSGKMSRIIGAAAPLPLGPTPGPGQPATCHSAEAVPPCTTAAAGGLAIDLPLPPDDEGDPLGFGSWSCRCGCQRRCSWGSAGRERHWVGGEEAARPALALAVAAAAAALAWAFAARRAAAPAAAALSPGMGGSSIGPVPLAGGASGPAPALAPLRGVRLLPPSGPSVWEGAEATPRPVLVERGWRALRPPDVGGGGGPSVATPPDPAAAGLPAAAGSAPVRKPRCGRNSSASAAASAVVPAAAKAAAPPKRRCCASSRVPGGDSCPSSSSSSSKWGSCCCWAAASSTTARPAPGDGDGDLSASGAVRASTALAWVRTRHPGPPPAANRWHVQLGRPGACKAGRGLMWRRPPGGRAAGAPATHCAADGAVSSSRGRCARCGAAWRTRLHRSAAAMSVDAAAVQLDVASGACPLQVLRLWIVHASPAALHGCYHLGRWASRGRRLQAAGAQEGTRGGGSGRHLTVHAVCGCLHTMYASTASARHRQTCCRCTSHTPCGQTPTASPLAAVTTDRGRSSANGQRRHSHNGGCAMVRCAGMSCRAVDGHRLNPTACRWEQVAAIRSGCVRACRGQLVGAPHLNCGGTHTQQ